MAAALDPSLVGDDFVRSVTALEAVFGLVGIGLTTPRIDWVWAPAVPVLLIEVSELVCAFAGKASVNAKKGTITKLPRCLGEANRHMSRVGWSIAISMVAPGATMHAHSISINLHLRIGGSIWQRLEYSQIRGAPTVHAAEHSFLLSEAAAGLGLRDEICGEWSASSVGPAVYCWSTLHLSLQVSSRRTGLRCLTCGGEMVLIKIV